MRSHMPYVARLRPIAAQRVERGDQLALLAPRPQARVDLIETPFTEDTHQFLCGIGPEPFPVMIAATAGAAGIADEDHIHVRGIAE
jgi:hypothetical protein